MPQPVDHKSSSPDGREDSGSSSNFPLLQTPEMKLVEGSAGRNRDDQGVETRPGHISSKLGGSSGVMGPECLDRPENSSQQTMAELEEELVLLKTVDVVDEHLRRLKENGQLAYEIPLFHLPETGGKSTLIKQLAVLTELLHQATQQSLIKSKQMVNDMVETPNQQATMISSDAANIPQSESKISTNDMVETPSRQQHQETETKENEAAMKIQCKIRQRQALKCRDAQRKATTIPQPVETQAQILLMKIRSIKCRDAQRKATTIHSKTSSSEAKTSTSKGKDAQVDFEEGKDAHHVDFEESKDAHHVDSEEGKDAQVDFEEGKDAHHVDFEESKDAEQDFDVSKDAEQDFDISKDDALFYLPSISQRKDDVSTENAKSYEVANSIWMYNAFLECAPEGADEQDILAWEETKQKHRHYLDFFKTLPKSQSPKDWESISWWYNPHSIPPDDATDDQINFWIEYSGRYANACALRDPYWTPDSEEQAHVEAMQKCKEKLKWNENQIHSDDDYDEFASISFGSFDTNMYFQPATNTTTSTTSSYEYDDKCTTFEIKFGDLESNEINQDDISFGSFNNILFQPAASSTTTVAPPYVYNDQCNTFEIKFGDLESNELDHKFTSSNQHLHRSHVPID